MIQSFKRVLFILVMVIVLAWCFLFALANDAEVPLDLLFWSAPARHMSWWLLIFFVAGLLLGWVMAVISGWLRAASKRRQAKTLAKSQ